jgi:hypothetical protein
MPRHRGGEPAPGGHRSACGAILEATLAGSQANHRGQADEVKASGSSPERIAPGAGLPAPE